MPRTQGCVLFLAKPRVVSFKGRNTMRINLNSWKLTLTSMFAIAAIISTGCASTSKLSNWAMGRSSTPATGNIAGTSSEAPAYGSDLGSYAGTPASSSTPTRTSSGLARSGYPAQQGTIQPNYASGVPSASGQRYPMNNGTSSAPTQQGFYSTTSPKPNYGAPSTGSPTASTYGNYPTTPSSATQPRVNTYPQSGPAAYTAAAPTGSRAVTYPTTNPSAASSPSSYGNTAPSNYSTGGSTYSSPAGTSGTYPATPNGTSYPSTSAPSSVYPSTSYPPTSYPTTSTPGANSFNSQASYQNTAATGSTPSPRYRPGGTTDYSGGGSSSASVYNVGENKPANSSIYTTGSASPAVPSTYSR